MKWIEINNVVVNALINLELVESIELNLEEYEIVFYTRHDYFQLQYETKKEVKEKYEELKRMLEAKNGI